MFRAFTAASLLVVTVTTTAQAQTYIGRGARIPYSAAGVCGSLLNSKNETKQFYRSWYDTCMRANGVTTTRPMEARGYAYPRYASR